MHNPIVLTLAALACMSCAQKKEPVTITVLNYLNLSDPNSANQVASIWDEFEKQNPDIQLVREDAFNEDFHAKTASYLKNGTMPDVFTMWSGGRSAALHTAHTAKDLTPFLEKDNLLKEYTETAIQPQYAGYLAELPDAITYTSILYTSTKLLKENGLSVPSSYRDFKAMVPVLKEKHIQVILMDNKDSWVMQSLLFSLVVGRYGGKDWFKNLETGKTTFTGKWFLKSLEIIDDMCRSGVISQETLNYANGDSPAIFAAGKAAFFIGGDWKTATFQTDKATGQGLLTKDAQQNDFELLLMPEFPGEILHDSDSGTVGSGWAMNAAISAGSKKEEAAWKLISYLESPYIQTYRLEIGTAFPTLKNLDIQKLADTYGLEPFTVKRADFYKKYPVITPVIDSVLPSEVYTVINEALHGIIKAQTSPEKAAADIQNAWEVFSSRQ